MHICSAKANCDFDATNSFLEGLAISPVDMIQNLFCDEGEHINENIAVIEDMLEVHYSDGIDVNKVNYRFTMNLVIW